MKNGSAHFESTRDVAAKPLKNMHPYYKPSTTTRMYQCRVAELGERGFQNGGSGSLLEIALYMYVLCM